MSSDLNIDAYNEVQEEAANTGKSIQQVLAERNAKERGELDFVYTQPPKNPKMVEEVRKTLQENSFVVRPKKTEEEKHE